MNADDARLQAIRDTLNALDTAAETMHGRISELAAIADAAERRKREAEERLANCERLYQQAIGPAERTTLLEVAAHKLVEALDRLPVRMEDAAMVQSSHPPAIPLYGTHDWTAVVDAKFGVKQLLRKEP